MSSPSNIPGGLAQLADWLADGRDCPPLGALLAGWCRAAGFRSAGLVWPVAAPTVVRLVKPDAAAAVADVAPAETAGVAKTLADGPPTVVWQMPHSAGRLYTLFTPAGRAPGAVWVERATGTWGDGDRNFLLLSARLIERSAVLAGLLGPVIDPARLEARLADAAVIAGRMAHEFDNILTGVIGFSDLSLPLVPANSQVAKYIADTGKVGYRGITFTQQLHALSRSGATKPLPGAVGAVAAKEYAKLAPGVPPDTRVVLAVPAGLSAVAMDTGPLAAVIGHLLANAVEATPAGGTVTVSARPVELSAADARSYLGQARPGPHVEVAVEDSGPGIAPDTRAKLFCEPFVTTKVRHRGLGLAVVYRTLCAHRGGVRLDPVPSPGAGTVARFVVPPAAARPAVVSNSAYVSLPRTGV